MAAGSKDAMILIAIWDCTLVVRFADCFIDANFNYIVEKLPMTQGNP
jgi:hypothetical protein